MEEIFKYIDIFGTKSYFFTNKERKFHTLYGGLLSIISILINFFIFLFLFKDNIQRKFPLSSFISEIRQENNTIKSKEEKIWIPWRILPDKNYMNYTGLPNLMISFNIEENNTINKTINLQSKKINYRLCNETSMINLLDLIYINAPLNKLYCIDSENLKTDDSHKNSKINYVKLDFYLYSNVNYDFTNDNNDSLKIELYYPKAHYNPTNKKKPFSIIYNKFTYNINKNRHKVDNVYLQKKILIDDQKWIIKSFKSNSYWSVSKIDENFFDYIIDSNKTIIYSINFYFDNILIQYYRSYKKILMIISEIFPIIYILYSIFKKTTKIFKSTDQNKILNELLFENIVGRVSKFTNFLNQIRMSNGDFNQNNNINNKSELAELQDIKCSLFNRNNQDNNSVFGRSNNGLPPYVSPNINNHMNFLNQYNDNSKVLIFKNGKNEVRNNNRFLKLDNQRLNCYLNKRVSISGKDFVHKDINIHGSKIKKNNNTSLNKAKEKNYEQSIVSQDVKKYESIKLFPYKYYFLSTFCKNLGVNKKKIFMAKKFVKANLFINQLMDVSSYIILQREFQVLKKKILSKEKFNLVEKNKKININSKTFIREVNECLEKKKFNILANSAY